jgi:hypothetical protein
MGWPHNKRFIFNKQGFCLAIVVCASAKLIEKKSTIVRALMGKEGF